MEKFRFKALHYENLPKHLKLEFRTNKHTSPKKTIAKIQLNVIPNLIFLKQTSLGI